MSTQRIRNGDEVIVISGVDKGRRGTVTSIRGDKLVVEGINTAKKHVRPNPNEGVQGGIEQHSMPIHGSNVMLYNPQSKQGERVGFKWLGSGDERRKVRVFRSSGEVVDA